MPKERLVEAQWAIRSGTQKFETDVEMLSDGQVAPILEILDVFAHEKLRIIATNTNVRGPRMRVLVSFEVNSIEQLKHLTTQLTLNYSVRDARRC